MQVPRDILYLGLSSNAIHLYLQLKELEQKYCGEEKNWFWRSNEDLTEELGWSLSKLKRAKKELTDAGLVQTWLATYKTDNPRKLSEKHVCGYRIA